VKRSLLSTIILLILPIISGYSLDFSPAGEFTKNCIVTPLPRLVKRPLPEPDSPDAGGFRYVIRKPSGSAGKYFQLSYNSPEPVQLILEYRQGPAEIRGLLPGRHTAAILITRESDLLSFTVQSRNRDVPPQVLAAGTVAEPEPSCDLKIRDKTFEMILEPDAEGGFGYFETQGQGIPEYRGNIRIAVFGERDRRADFRLEILPGINRFYLYRNQIGFSPRRMVIEGEQPFLLITGGSLSIPENRDEPISADVNTILDWNPSLWRRSDFELFSWTVAPQVYVIAFKDQPTQSEYLTRLSFHQEKRYSRGSLLSDETLKGRHGWNAHDYGSEGLAEFFEQASTERFPLNKRELALRDLLLTLGIIRVDGKGHFVPGTGAIISINQKRSREERLFYLAHELSHGLFFTDPQLRREIGDLWAVETEEFRFIWRSFLWEYSYDSTHEYLVINEYFGYMLQMPVDELDSYFNDRIISLFPESSANGKKIRRIIWSNEKQFSQAGRRIEKVLYRLYGLKAGRFYCLTRL
jgi:hypothetical protein